MLAMWGIALAIVIVQSDLGAALLYFLVFLALLYVATRRISYVVFGLLLFFAGGAVLYQLVPVFRNASTSGSTHSPIRRAAATRSLSALYAYGRGGILGTGIGAGLPQIGSRAVHPAHPH